MRAWSWRAAHQIDSLFIALEYLPCYHPPFIRRKISYFKMESLVTDCEHTLKTPSQSQPHLISPSSPPHQNRKALRQAPDITCNRGQPNRSGRISLTSATSQSRSAPNFTLDILICHKLPTASSTASISSHLETYSERQSASTPSSTPQALRAAQRRQHHDWRTLQNGRQGEQAAQDEAEYQ